MLQAVRQFVIVDFDIAAMVMRTVQKNICMEMREQDLCQNVSVMQPAKGVVLK